MKQTITIEIDLDKIPDWANYITFDEDGVWAHEKTPYIGNPYAYTSDAYCDNIEQSLIMQVISIERHNNNENNNYNKEHQLRTYKSE